MVIQYEHSIGYQMQKMVATLTQDSVASFVIAFLEKHGIPYEQIEGFGIFYVDHLDEPVLKCSLDGVSNPEDMSLLYHLEWDHTPLLASRSTAVGKDKALDVILHLKLLQKCPNLNFVFNRRERQEELGLYHLFEDEDW